ncbi:Ig-like domain-containing protein [Microbacteriaceae bacterium]|nr:Ig-like domain-containing protein [Candidatus Saccharibacteria bacterium]
MKLIFQQKMHFLAAVLLASFLMSPVALGVGPSINAHVYDGHVASLTITSLQNNAVVSVSPVLVEGAVRNISQIMVYVDGTYSMTYPIDNGATSYSFTASVGVGSHILKLIAINPYDGTTVEQSVSFTYTPGAQPSAPVEAVKVATQTAQVTQEYLQGQVDQASTTKPALFLSDLTYDVMTALDLAPHTGQQPVPYMLSRFWAIIAGIALIILANPVITLYHMARYQLLQWKVHAFPKLVRHHAVFVLRTGGVFLLVIGFFM